MNIKGLNIKNFTCFGSAGVYIEDISRINIFFGENNCGKSNSLRIWKFLKQLPFPEGSRTQTFSIDEPNYFYKFNQNNKIEIRFDFDNEELKEIKEELNYDGTPYVVYSITKNGKDFAIQVSESFLNECTEPSIREFVQKKKGVSGGRLQDRVIDVLHAINPKRFIAIPNVEHIDEFRKLVNEQDIRKDLHSIVHYSYKNIENKEKKQKLNNFIESVLGYSAEITIPDTEQEIEIVINGFQQPLSSVGTGVHEIILIGLKLFLLKDKAIVCIDEPELHLHPRVQRSFLNFISTETDHTYFIATHSNNFLDFEVEDKQIYRVFKEGDEIQINVCPDLQSQRSILNDLGVRASEILQTNGIVWVEGPSDRIYIKKWLALFSPELVEGLHFNFQYYSGRLLNHYSLEDFEFNDFLNILTVNKNAFIVMDSDCSKNYQIADLNSTKQRIIEECESAGIGYWVTEGREIENYLSNSLLERITEAPVKRSKFTKIGSYCEKFNPQNKIIFAKEAVDLMEGEEMRDNFDLYEKITDLVQNIKSWNNL